MSGWFRMPVTFNYRDRWPPVEVIREQRRAQLLKARAIRNALIAERLANPRIRKAITKEIIQEPRSGAARTAARFYKLATKETTCR